MRRTIGAIVAAAILLITTTASAQSVNIEAIADEIESNGRFLERSVTGEAEAAIGRANANGVAFVRLDNTSESSEIAETLLAELQSRNSQYGAVVVLTNAAVFARGKGGSASALTDSITQTFGGGDIAAGIDQYLTNVGDDAAGGFANSATTGGDSGGGFPWIVPIILAIGAYFLFNMMRGRRKTKNEEIKTLEEDRQEIIEQLKANADRVIDLGDEVIQANDPELISIYEEASAAYQNVSNGIRDADTIAKVDVLDDQIDKAEWQFEVIEARLTGQTPPPFLDSDRTDEPTPPAPTPPPPQATPAQRDAQYRRRGQQPRPLPRRNPRYQPQQRRRSGMGGMFGKMALSVLMSMLMGGRMGQPRTSRRTQRRRGGGGFGGIQMPF